MSPRTLAHAVGNAVACLTVVCTNVQAQTEPVCPVLLLTTQTPSAIGDTIYPAGPALASFTVEVRFYIDGFGELPIVLDNAYAISWVNVNDQIGLYWTISTGPTTAVGGGFPGLHLAQEWNHAALTFNAETKQVVAFFNGTRGSPETVQISQFGRRGDHFLVGTDPGGTSFFRGKMDDIRVSSIVRYTEDFAPPTRLSVDAHTVALYRFSDPPDATSFANAVSNQFTLMSADGARTESNGVGCSADTSWANSTLTPGFSTIRKVHIEELRSRIDAIRAVRGLTAFAWTDPILSAQSTEVKAIHIEELRGALGQAYSAIGKTPPTYTDPSLSAGATIIRAAHIAELRAAVQAIE